MPQEGDLVRAAQAGSHEAFRVLVDRYHLLMLRTAQILLGDSSTAEDVAQEAWVNVWRALSNFDHSRPFRPWLLHIVTNCCRMEQRRVSPQMAPDGAEATLQAPEGDLLDGVIRREQFAALDAVITTLPEAQRQLVELRYRADLELAEIALVTGLPIGTVKSRLHRALTAIRRLLADAGVATREEKR
jgi:RNA polymerase sigma factor (sigma-70 family)